MRDDLEPTCPVAGKYYACATGSKFIGCCTVDPCSNGCPSGNLEPVQFNPNLFGQIPDASCGNAANFWTCKGDGLDRFWGCCKSDPCQTAKRECPEGDLVGAFIDKPEQSIAYLPESSTSTVPSSTSTSTTTSSSSSPTSTPAASSSKSNTKVIAGAAAGGALILALIIFLVWFCLRKRRRASKAKAMSQTNESGAFLGHSTPGPNTPSADVKAFPHSYTDGNLNSPYSPPPPQYASPALGSAKLGHSPLLGHTQYAHEGTAMTFAAELPAEEVMRRRASQRMSELPAATETLADRRGAGQRISELPAQTEAVDHISELPTPHSGGGMNLLKMPVETKEGASGTLSTGDKKKEQGKEDNMV